MKLVAAIALAACATVLSAGSPAGAARSLPHHALGFLPRAAHPAMPAPARRAAKPAPFGCVSACADYETTINQYFTDLAADSANNVTTNVYSVLPEYSAQLNSTTFAGSFVDESPLPTTQTCNDKFDTYCVTKKQLQAEMSKVIVANQWPTQSQTTLYFIFTPANVGVCIHPGQADPQFNPCTTNAFCAFHSHTNSFLYAVEPDAAATKDGGCDAGQAPAGNNADSTLSTVSHEHIEAITDPYGNGWWSEDEEQLEAFYGSEIGDLCAWNFGADLGTTLEGQSYNQVINGHDYYLQQEWSNVATGCVQQAGGTASNYDTMDPFYAGTGPLVYHDGPVMTTNTVYAIYWVPVAPTNHTPPKIVGAAKLGKTLKALHGAWSNPVDYSYWWLRCSSSGTTCKGIRRATDSKYTLMQADAGHRIEVRVTVTNQAGHAIATSAPTAKVKS